MNVTVSQVEVLAATERTYVSQVEVLAATERTYVSQVEVLAATERTERAHVSQVEVLAATEVHGGSPRQPGGGAGCNRGARREPTSARWRCWLQQRCTEGAHVSQVEVLAATEVHGGSPRQPGGGAGCNRGARREPTSARWRCWLQQRRTERAHVSQVEVLAATEAHGGSPRQPGGGAGCNRGARREPTSARWRCWLQQRRTEGAHVSQVEALAATERTHVSQVEVLAATEAHGGSPRQPGGGAGCNRGARREPTLARWRCWLQQRCTERAHVSQVEVLAATEARGGSPRQPGGVAGCNRGARRGPTSARWRCWLQQRRTEGANVSQVEVLAATEAHGGSPRQPGRGAGCNRGARREPTSARWRCWLQQRRTEGAHVSQVEVLAATERTERAHVIQVEVLAATEAHGGSPR